MSHTHFLRHCLALAEKGRGKTGINPMVGAVLVRHAIDNGKLIMENDRISTTILVEGYHTEFGSAHAERDLLATYTGDILPTDILYVNLEPCCHRNKKTPPCTDIIIERGVRHVVYGMKDPNPDVSGKGIDYLSKKGVQVLGPILEQECRRLNRGFVSLMTKGRPWITMKKAQMVDGRTANADGSTLKITTSAQDAWSHAFLRAKHDAILVGVGTVLADDPLLTVRSHTPNSSPIGRGEARAVASGGVRGWRIILDPHLKIPPLANVVGPQTIIITSPGSDADKRKSLESAGVRIFDVPYLSGFFDWSLLWKALMTPGNDFYGISSILVEGGQKTWDCFKKAGMVDEEVTLMGE